MAVIEGIRVLLHQHHNTVENEEDGMSPWPVSPQCQTDHATDEGCLPYL